MNKIDPLPTMPRRGPGLSIKALDMLQQIIESRDIRRCIFPIGASPEANELQRNGFATLEHDEGKTRLLVTPTHKGRAFHALRKRGISQ